MDIKEAIEPISLLLHDPVQDVRKAALTALRHMLMKDTRNTRPVASRGADGTRSWVIENTTQPPSKDDETAGNRVCARLLMHNTDAPAYSRWRRRGIFVPAQTSSSKLTIVLVLRMRFPQVARWNGSFHMKLVTRCVSTLHHVLSRCWTGFSA